MSQQPSQSSKPLPGPTGANRPDVDELLQQVADILRLMGEPTRLRILLLLSQQGELCVTDIHTRLQISQHAASIRLRQLYHRRLVRFRRVNHRVYYQLTDPSLLPEAVLSRLLHVSTGSRR